MNHKEREINSDLYNVTEKILNFIRGNIKKNLDALDMSDLTFAEINTLMVIGDNDPKSMKEIVAELDVANSTPTRTIDRLVSKGFVYRCSDEGDRRKVLVQLTPDGLSAIEKIERKRDEQLHKAFSSLSQSEKRSFASILYKIKSNLTEE